MPRDSKRIAINDNFLAENCGPVVDGLASDVRWMLYWMSLTAQRINRSIWFLLLLVRKTEDRYACVKCSGKMRAGKSKIHLSSSYNQRHLQD